MSTLREQISRIVDPKSWETFDRWADSDFAGVLRAECDAIVRPSLAKADQILALLPLQPEGEVVEAEQALQAAKSLMIASGWWSNPAGYRTDAALWIEKAIRGLDRAKREGEEQGASRTSHSSEGTLADPIGGLSDGWRLVPIEPTLEMLQPACNEHTPGQSMGTSWRDGVDYGEECPKFIVRRKVWASMVSATPPPPNGLLGDEG